MINSINDCTVLKNGVKMPWFGFGVWRLEDADECAACIKTAVNAGYRSIDTAAIYMNEEAVGKAVKECGVPRSELFVTTKVWNAVQGYDSTLKAFDESLSKLGLDYLDLYLIHWPKKGLYKDRWRAIEKLYNDGRVRAIGVSNFQVHHLEDLFSIASVIPMVNQVEYHPLLTQLELHSFCKKHGIQLEAWSPLIQGNLDIPLLAGLGRKYGKSTAQIILRWDLQNEVVTIPKSSNAKRIIENADIFDFVISDEDMGAINGLNENRRVGADPDNFTF